MESGSSVAQGHQKTKDLLLMNKYLNYGTLLIMALKDSTAVVTFLSFRSSLNHCTVTQ